ncbi:MAG: lysyl oxidase family protein [Actinomycetota bacterium]
MSPGRRHRPLVPIALAVALLATLYAAPVGAASTPTLRLFVSSTQVTVERGRRDVVDVDPGAFITAVGGAFELRVGRPDYDTPITVKQVDAQTGAVLRTFSDENLDGWFGLKDFAHYQVVDAQGQTVLADTVTFCPNGYIRERVSDDSPLATSYPYSCGSSSPFTRGSVWGIDRGWASSLIGGGDYYGGLRWRAERSVYTVKIQIDPAWVSLLSIAPSDASAQVQVTAVDGGMSAPARTPSPSSTYAPYPKTPILTTPPAETLPDFVALPGWGISAYPRKGHDYLTFNATEWNAGPGTMLVDGFRSGQASTLDAYQYFLLDGQPVGRALIGQLEYHAGRHNHWHFQEFTQYSLLDADKRTVQVSDKESWCLAPTDAIDLTVPNANWRGSSQDLFTSCGYNEPGALWVREVLDVGWGDTYGQDVNSGAFDISDLPNGRYYLRTQVDPTGEMYEVSADNNIQDRLIRLRGKPGHRRVVVPPWHGIDTEHYCSYCG